ncbi:G-protein coupled receptor 4 family protein [Abortiporus biennis]
MVAIDLALGLFSPLLHLPIFFFVQGHRFDILEGVGCSSAVPNTYLAIFLYTFWHIIIGVISLSYAGRTLRTLIISRKKIQESVSSIGDLSMSCYIRLMVMTLVEILFTIPLSTWRFVVVLQTPIYPWKGLADLHEGFERVRQFPLELWISDESAVRSIVYLQYATIVIGLIFFFVFGFSKESKDYYFSMGRFIFSRLGSVMKRFTSTEDVDLKTNDCISNARSETTSSTSDSMSYLKTCPSTLSTIIQLDSTISINLNSSFGQIAIDDDNRYAIAPFASPEFNPPTLTEIESRGT